VHCFIWYCGLDIASREGSREGSPVCAFCRMIFLLPRAALAGLFLAMRHIAKAVAARGSFCLFLYVYILWYATVR
jgi:hypothetical protein